mmetsp:Transcript_99596/g.286110  ORF Transcript_99596/g.286110 Transcript_99596/m.286110 type:complete len:267 (-) Transcript_99596:141-941(-)
MNSVWPPKPVAIVGKPDAIASMTGKHQPSPCVGRTKASADRYKIGIASAGSRSLTISMRCFASTVLAPSSRKTSSVSVIGLVLHSSSCVLINNLTVIFTVEPSSKSTTVSRCGKADQKVCSSARQFFLSSHLKRERKVKVRLSTAWAMKSSSRSAPVLITVARAAGAMVPAAAVVVQLKIVGSTASGSVAMSSFRTPEVEKTRVWNDEGTHTASKFALQLLTAAVSSLSTSTMLLLTRNRPRESEGFPPSSARAALRKGGTPQTPR